MTYFTQEQIFLFFLVIGIIIGIIFDVFKAIRINTKSNDTLTFICDTVFLVISGNLILYSIIKINNGYIRLYIFFAILFGISIYFLTISNICVIILSIFIKLCKNIFNFPIFCYSFIKNICTSLKKKDF